MNRGFMGMDNGRMTVGVGVDRAVESNGVKCGTTAIGKQLKINKFKNIC